jgi:hypothetical protein
MDLVILTTIINKKACYIANRSKPEYHDIAKGSLNVAINHEKPTILNTDDQ